LGKNIRESGVDGRSGKIVVVVVVVGVVVVGVVVIAIPTRTVPALRVGSRTQIHPSKNLR
jgi:hypothetical protein